MSTKGRSPNYPIKPLGWAVEQALGLLEQEGLHGVPPDIIAQYLGYKDAKNGNSRRVLANLKAFGVIEKVASGKLSVSQDVQRYKLMPTENEKNIYLKQWIKKPLLYKKILNKYGDDLPSDAVLLFELVDEYGFSEVAAKKAIKVFRESLSFISTSNDSDEIDMDDDSFDEELIEPPIVATTERAKLLNSQTQQPLSQNDESFKYPVRLYGGRMAWVEVPVPFYSTDKEKILAQIQVIGTDDEDI